MTKNAHNRKKRNLLKGESGKKCDSLHHFSSTLSQILFLDSFPDTPWSVERGSQGHNNLPNSVLLYLTIKVYCTLPYDLPHVAALGPTLLNTALSYPARIFLSTIVLFCSIHVWSLVFYKVGTFLLDSSKALFYPTQPISKQFSLSGRGTSALHSKGRNGRQFQGGIFLNSIPSLLCQSSTLNICIIRERKKMNNDISAVRRNLYSMEELSLC